VGDQLIAFLLLFGSPVLLGVLLWVLIRLDDDGDDPGATPFDPPPWWG
jgi:hypothetical protein